MMRTTVIALGIAACAAAAAIAAPQAGIATICDTIGAAARAGTKPPAEAGTIWSRLTSGTTPLIQLATVELSLERDLTADDRIQFEKRFRGRYGNGDEVIKELRTRDEFDVFGLPGSAVHMLVTTSGSALCESRMFFRATTSREAVRVPDPPADNTNDAETTLCEKRGGWGFFARVAGVEAFVEYRAAEGRESLRIVPLTNAGWQPGCILGAVTGK